MYYRISSLNLTPSYDMLIEIVRSGDVEYLDKINRELYLEHGSTIGFIGSSLHGPLEFAINDNDDIKMFKYLHERHFCPISCRHLYFAFNPHGKMRKNMIKYMTQYGNTTHNVESRAGVFWGFLNSFESNGIYTWDKHNLKSWLQDQYVRQWFMQQDLSPFCSLKQSFEELMQSYSTCVDHKSDAENIEKEVSNLILNRETQKKSTAQFRCGGKLGSKKERDTTKKVSKDESETEYESYSEDNDAERNLGRKQHVDIRPQYICITHFCAKRKGDLVKHKVGESYIDSEVVEVHYENYPDLYYTIKQSDDRIIQTIPQKLYC